MRDIRPFMASGKTVTCTAAATPPTAVQPVNISASNSILEGCQFRIQNNGAVTAFYAYGVDATAAEANAVIPTGTARHSYPLGAGGIEVITAPRGSYFSATTASSTAVIYITPGAGV